MNLEQAGILALMVVLLGVFAMDRFRIELVALSGLAVAVLLGLVPAARAFEGFASPAVITVAEILIIVHLLLRSRLVDWAGQALARRVRSRTGAIASICGFGAAASVFMNNLGALALMLPLAFSLCRTLDIRPGDVLMPLSFATLLGGTCSIIGTPANLVVSGFSQETTGAPFHFFETAAMGLPALLVGLAWLIFAAPRLLARRGLEETAPRIPGPRRFVTELRIREGASFAGLPLAEVEARLGGVIHSHLRGGRHVFGRRGHRKILGGDLILVETDVGTAMDLNRRGEAEVVTERQAGGEQAWVEAVVLPQSVVLGSAARGIAAFDDFRIELVALSPQTQRIEGRLADIPLGAGDVILLRGEPSAIRQALAEVDCLEISPRGVQPPERRSWAVLAVFGAAIAIAATERVAPEIAFGGALLALASFGLLNLREAIADLNWPILLMLAAMIPLGQAVGDTGAADVVANGLLAASGATSLLGLAGVVLLATVLITPFVNNVSTAAALAPVAVAMARSAGVEPDLLLVAVAVGASLDFLTPFGHHNNTLIMGVGNYRFGDFLRVGAPLLILTAGAGLAAIALLP